MPHAHACRCGRETLHCAIDDCAVPPDWACYKCQEEALEPRRMLKMKLDQRHLRALLNSIPSFRPFIIKESK